MPQVISLGKFVELSVSAMNWVTTLERDLDEELKKDDVRKTLGDHVVSNIVDTIVNRSQYTFTAFAGACQFAGDMIYALDGVNNEDYTVLEDLCFQVNEIYKAHTLLIELAERLEFGDAKEPVNTLGNEYGNFLLEELE